VFVPSGCRGGHAPFRETELVWPRRPAASRRSVQRPPNASAALAAWGVGVTECFAPPKCPPKTTSGSCGGWRSHRCLSAGGWS
jgi:hypothetical protein